MIKAHQTKPKRREGVYLKKIQNNDSKNVKDSLGTRIEKMQEKFNKDLEEIKK